MGHATTARAAYAGRSGPVPRRIPRWIIGLVALALLISVVVAFGASFLQVYRLKREAARLERVRQNLIEQNAQLREEIKLLHTPNYIERIAREQLGLVKPGEVALLIVRPQAEPGEAAGSLRLRRPAPPERASWPVRAWRTLLRQLGR